MSATATDLRQSGASDTLPAGSKARRAIGRLGRRVHDAAFSRVHRSTLIYNTCWEDPRLDREALAFSRDSRIVMITSAGCNALDYLLDDPAEIHAVDLNPRQNALLELKIALFASGDRRSLWSLLGEGSHPVAREMLESVMPSMPAYAQTYWRKHAGYFDPESLRGSFYFRGGSGFAAWLLRGAILRKSAKRAALVDALLASNTLDEQRERWARIEPLIWTGLTRWLVRQPSVMALLGVPRPQIKLILESDPGGLAGFVRDRLRHVMTELPLADNYFWRVYMTGRYTASCCPEYLRPERFATIADRVGRVRARTMSLSEFLRRHPGRYSHFILLDHQDWLAAHDPASLAEEWELILRNSAPNAKVLLRSAGPDLSFIPEAIRSKLRWNDALTKRLHTLDRVGTYASMHVGEVIAHGS
jgi:S-adenosylmethionine-diacylglycerol 3-amino-3-carboxypropyl transferase